LSKERDNMKSELDEQIDRTLRLNKAAVKQAERRAHRLDQAVERSVRVIDRAMRHLRQGSVG